MAEQYRRFMDYLEHWANHGVPQMLATVLSAVAIGLGTSMWIDPDNYKESDSFRLVFLWASPHAWGTLYIVAAIAVLVMVYTNARTARMPVFMLGLTYIAQGILTIPQTANGGLPSAIFMYIGMGWIGLITQLVCGVAGRKDRDAQASSHYLS